MKSVTVPSSAADVVANPAAFLKALRKAMPDFDYRAAAAVAAEVAEEELLEEMVSYRKSVTGVDNTIFISPRGNTRHAPRIKLAIDPPDSLNPQSQNASIAIADGTAVEGAPVPPHLAAQVRRFLEANRDVLLDYWEYRIDTEELRQRLKAI
jgi:hypothetical protein